MQPFLWLSHLVQGLLWPCEESMVWCICIVSFIKVWGPTLFLKGLLFFKVIGCFRGVILKAVPSGYCGFCSWSWWSESIFSAADQQESFKERKQMVGTPHEIEYVDRSDCEIWSWPRKMNLFVHHNQKHGQKVPRAKVHLSCTKSQRVKTK